MQTVFVNGVRPELDYVLECAIDTANNIYISGWTNSTTNIATIGSYQSGFAGSYDGLLAKFNANGVREWGTY